MLALGQIDDAPGDSLRAVDERDARPERLRQFVLEQRKMGAGEHDRVDQRRLPAGRAGPSPARANTAGSTASPRSFASAASTSSGAA